MGAALLNHLWQSTLFAITAWMLTLVLKDYSARTRYWVWFAASVKFLIPFAVLLQLGLRLRPSGSVGIGLLPEPLLSATLQLAEPAAIARSTDSSINAGSGFLLAMLWASGVAIVLARWLHCWVHARSLVRMAQPHSMDIPVEVRVSKEVPEPGVFGITQPVLLLPSGVLSRLSAAELDMVIAHELCHVRNRDNLTAAVHMFIQAVFWFHPMVWWIGRRMLEERERACDEAVIEHGAAPHVYAEGILKACKLSLESRLGVVAAAGGNLKHRLEAIIHWRPTRKLNPVGKAGLIAMAVASIALPLLTGFAMPQANTANLAVSQPGAQRFDSAIIELTSVNSPEAPRLILTPTHLSMRNTSLRKLISVASGLRERQVMGGPVWLDWRYDIEASASSTIHREMILRLLTERFELQFIDRNPGSSGKESA